VYENASLAGVITTHGSQNETRNIERAIHKSQRNINSVESAKDNTPEPPNMLKGKNKYRRLGRNKVSAA
jgi:hypothetical protein